MRIDDLPSNDGAEFDESDPSLELPIWIIANQSLAKSHGFPSAAYMPVHERQGVILPVFRDEDSAKLFIERKPLADCCAVEIASLDRWVKLLGHLKTQGGTSVGIDLQAEPDRRGQLPLDPSPLPADNLSPGSANQPSSSKEARS